jgi:hypothetical protein
MLPSRQKCAHAWGIHIPSTRGKRVCARGYLSFFALFQDEAVFNGHAGPAGEGRSCRDLQVAPNGAKNDVLAPPFFDTKAFKMLPPPQKCAHAWGIHISSTRGKRVCVRGYLSFFCIFPGRSRFQRSCWPGRGGSIPTIVGPAGEAPFQHDVSKWLRPKMSGFRAKKLISSFSRRRTVRNENMLLTRAYCDI